MASKLESDRSEQPRSKMLPMFDLGKTQTEAMLNIQKEMMAAYEQASRSWVERVRAEVELWSDLASKLSTSGSTPDGLQVCRDSIAKRMQMAAADGQRLFEEGQKVIGAITRSLGNGWLKDTTS